MDGIEQKPLLIDEQTVHVICESNTARRSQSDDLSRRSCIYFLVLQAILVGLYTAGSLIIIRHNTTNISDIHATAFPGLLVQYRSHLYERFVNSPFAGEPRPESDLAWHTLLNNMSVRVTAEELEAHGQTSISLPNGGHLAWLGVFHDLHCVKMLRHWSWREHYFPNLTAHDHKHHMLHVDHCLEWLRNGAICRADTSALAVFKWEKSMPHPVLDSGRVEHSCVDWDAMMNSHAERHVLREEVAGLKNPLMETDKESEDTST